VGRIITGSAWALQAFDPDGAGPLGTWLIAGGSPSGPTGVFAGKVIAFDGTSWRNLDSVPAVSGSVAALSVFNGQLVAGGSFGSLGGVVANGVAKWNGTTWEPMGAGIGGGSGVRDFAVFGGALIAAGDFSNSGPTVLADLARWDGSNWVAFGSTNAGGRVQSLATVGGSLYAGGVFSSVNGSAISNLARWNGTSWLASGQPTGEVTALASYSSVSPSADRLFVGGSFSSIGGQSISQVAIFSPNAGTWQAAGTPPAGSVADLFVRNVGASSYQLSGVIGSQHYVFGSGTWTANGEHGGRGSRIGLYGGQYALSRSSGFMEESAVLLWNGTQWSAPGTGVPANISTMLDKGDGSLVVGTFGKTGTVGRSRNFAWQLAADGTTWTQLGGELRHQNSATQDYLIKAFARLPNGDIVMGGRFAGIGDVTAPWVARWNGSAWTTLGTMFDYIVYDLQTMLNGDVVAAGTFTYNVGGPLMSGIARWNGAAWTTLGGGLPNGYANVLALAPNGDLIAAGRFSNAGGVPANNIARWNGTAWSALGPGLPHPTSQSYFGDVAVLTDGRIVVSMNIPDTTPPQALVYLWNSSWWNQIASTQSDLLPLIETLEARADGSLIAAGSFTSINGVAVQSIAQWNGSWEPAGEVGLYERDIASGTPLVGVVYDLESTSNALLAGGCFTHADNRLSAFLAQWRAPAGCDACDSIDFNNDGGVFDPTDIDAFLSVFSEGPCIPANATCNDIDFNNDGGLFDPCDIDSFLLVFSEGPCTLCGE
jgi:hypothetical protein